MQFDKAVSLNTMQTILVVDDQKNFRKAVCDLLIQAGFVTIEASNGIEAISLYKAHQPDLVLLDIVMPEMDGRETCRIIRQMSEEVPVIFLSGLSEADDIERGLDLDPMDYIPKDFEPKVLVAKVRRWTRSPIPKQINVEGDLEISYGSLRIDQKSRRYIYLDEKRVELSPKEFEIMVKLVKEPDKAWSHDELRSQHSGEDVVRRHVLSIRNKFEDAGCKAPIETLRKHYQLRLID